MFGSFLHNNSKLCSKYALTGSNSYIKRFCSKVNEKLNKKPKSLSPNSYNPKISSPSLYGQPTHATHPHLLDCGELLPGLKVEEFKERRKNLMNLIFSETLSIYDEPKHHVVILPAATKTYMTETIPYVFRQNTDFLYLSGCLEPDTALILTGSCEDDYLSTIFLRKQDSHSVLWEGPRTGIDVALDMFGVDQAFYVDDLYHFLLKNSDDHPESLLYYDAKHLSLLPLNKTIKHVLHTDNFKLNKSTKFFLHKLRAIKSPAEQNLMRKAGEISSKAIKSAMKMTKPGITEHQLFSVIDYESRMLGAEFLAYPPVVASGNNSTIIHYINNNQLIKDGDLILMDAGCECHGYCGDITRTWPANGQFTNYQKILYEIVLETQKQIIALSEERKSLDFLFHRMVKILGKYLSDEKIIKKEVQSVEEIYGVASQLCPHRVSHYLGMDVHDVASYPKNVPLQAGMVVTVEPGLYVNENNWNVFPEFWKIGIRIEDDVLITKTGCEILSKECPKEISDIEKLMK